MNNKSPSTLTVSDQTNIITQFKIFGVISLIIWICGQYNKSNKHLYDERKIMIIRFVIKLIMRVRLWKVKYY